MSGRYRTIVADPPWEYANFPSMRGAGPKRRAIDPSALRSVRQPLPYKSMAVEEIAALPVGDLAEEDAGLFLWTTNRYLHDAFHVMEAWEFNYVQTVVWVKDRRSPFIASLAPNHAEYLLAGKRGSHRWKDSLRSNVVEIAYGPQAKRAAHSTKPEAFLDEIERVSSGPWVELFARRARFGWDYAGDESLGTAEMPEAAA